MSSGNTATEYARRELAADEAVIREAALVRNAVLRRALAIAACEYADLAQSANTQADAGIGLMVCWVMRASDELERQGPKEQGAKGPRGQGTEGEAQG
jgi:hypothetical protein